MSENKHPLAYDPMAPQKRTAKIKLRFGQKIKQTGENEIDVEVEETDYPPFSDRFAEQVTRTMGLNRGEQLLDELGQQAVRRMILDGVY